MKNPYDDLRTMTASEICQGLGAQAVLFVGLGIGLWASSGRYVADFLSVSFREIGLGIGLAAALILVAGGLFRVFPDLAERMIRLQARNFAFLANGLPFPVIIFISICAGVGEEAFFRAGLQTLISDYAPLPVAIVGASFLFMLIHFAKPLIAAVIFVIGALFGVAYWWTESLLAVMIGHALYDVYAFWRLEAEMRSLGLFDEIEEPSANCAAEA